jgi:SET domain-containing protein
MLKVPHTVIQPSEISGVGCFSTHDIAAGTAIDYMDCYDQVFVEDLMVQRHDDVACWVERFCYKVEGGWMCPDNFDNFDNTWRMNHENEPSVGYSIEDGHEVARALRDIVAYKTELTLDYRELESGREIQFDAES